MNILWFWVLRVAPVLERLGVHKTSEINVSVYGENQPIAQRLYDSVGWP